MNKQKRFVNYFTLSDKLSERTEQRTFMFRLAYINHIDRVAKKIMFQLIKL